MSMSNEMHCKARIPFNYYVFSFSDIWTLLHFWNNIKMTSAIVDHKDAPHQYHHPPSVLSLSSPPPGLDMALLHICLCTTQLWWFGGTITMVHLRDVVNSFHLLNETERVCVENVGMKCPNVITEVSHLRLFLFKPLLILILKRTWNK